MPRATRRHRRRVRKKALSLRTSCPHTEQRRCDVADMSYQHRGHRRRPRERSPNIAHSPRASPPRPTRDPEIHQIQSIQGIAKESSRSVVGLLCQNARGSVKLVAPSSCNSASPTTRTRGTSTASVCAISTPTPTSACPTSSPSSPTGGRVLRRRPQHFIPSNQGLRGP